MKLYKFTAVFSPEKDKDFVGSFNVSFPALPGCLTCGDSLEEARFMAKDALECYLESLVEDGEKIPSDARPKRVTEDSIVEEIPVAVEHQVKAGQFFREFQTAFA